MIKTIIFQGRLGNAETLYNSIKVDNRFKNHKKILINYDFNNEVKFKRLNYYKYILNKIGFFRLIYLILSKNSILVTEGVGGINKIISRNIIFINHGWGTKMSPGKNEYLDISKMNNYYNIINTVKYIICNSQFDEKYFLNGVIGKEKIEFLPLGSPRNDIMINNNNDNYKNKLKEKYNFNNEKIYLYCPTHRENLKYNKLIMEKILDELVLLDKLLEGKNIILLFRPHYFDNGYKNKFLKFNNIKYVGIDIVSDVRELMILSDYLIADYSSIYIDYLLLNKPIIHYCFDLEKYSDVRGLVIDYNNNIHFPGHKIDSLSEIVQINTVGNINYDESKRLFFKYNDNKATDRIKNTILRISIEN